MTTSTSSALAVAVVALVAGCTMAPRVVALPGTGKTFEQFSADDGGCRTWASEQQGSRTQWRYDAAYMQCMYARGHRVPVPGGSGYTSPRLEPARTAPSDAPPPPGTPPPPPPGPAR